MPVNDAPRTIALPSVNCVNADRRRNTVHHHSTAAAGGGADNDADDNDDVGDLFVVGVIVCLRQALRCCRCVRRLIDSSVMPRV